MPKWKEKRGDEDRRNLTERVPVYTIETKKFENVSKLNRKKFDEQRIPFTNLILLIEKQT